MIDLQCVIYQSHTLFILRYCRGFKLRWRMRQARNSCGMPGKIPVCRKCWNGYTAMTKTYGVKIFSLIIPDARVDQYVTHDTFSQSEDP